MMILGWFVTVNPIFAAVIGLQIWNIWTCLTISSDHNPSGGAWMSFEFFGWPPIGSYIHGYASSGAAVYNFLFWPATDYGVLMYIIYGAYIHDWTWLSI